MGTIRFDRSKERLQRLAEKAYGEGKYISALRFACAAIDEGGPDVDGYLRIADV